MNSVGKVAVLIFTLSSFEEQKSKRFIGDSNIAQLLNDRIINTVQKSGLDFFVYNELQQKGKTFGERYANAIDEVFLKGYTSVITVGNDSPNLKVSHLLKSKDQLNNNGIVIGPSYDGGFYLLGIQKECFNKADFVQFSWNTSKVRGEVLTYLKTFTSNIKLLDYLYDIDAVSDLKSIYKSLNTAFQKLNSCIQKIIKPLIVTLYNINTTYLKVVVRFLFNKGSPQFIF